jgi:molybdopterin synthase catalytic subunit
MIKVRVQIEPFDIGAETALLGGNSAGAIASFTGIVRSDNGVTAIELEHYPAMTEASLSVLAHEAAERWALTDCVLIHRVGRMAVGEGIVLVITASPHRAQALDACAFLIDRLKTEAPFWKKEFRGEVAQWVEAKASDVARADKWH